VQNLSFTALIRMGRWTSTCTPDSDTIRTNKSQKI
jgi:hypothetical protein